MATLSTKDEVEFGNALLATGANVRRLRVDGCELEGIHYLRAFGNSDAIRAERRAGRARGAASAAATSAREVAASLTSAHGKQVLDRDARGRHASSAQFGPEVGGFFQGVLEEHGVEIHGGDELERFEGVRRAGRARWSPRAGSSSTATSS